MMRLDWLNLTFDSERDGMSTYGARPRSTDFTTSSARSRIEPSVFLSFAVSVTLSEGFFVFLAILRFLRIHDDHIVAELFLRLRDCAAALVEFRVGHSGFAFRDVREAAIDVFPAPVAATCDCRADLCDVSQLRHE